jgi:hypothetical protein
MVGCIWDRTYKPGIRTQFYHTNAVRVKIICKILLILLFGKIKRLRDTKSHRVLLFEYIFKFWDTYIIEHMNQLFRTQFYDTDAVRLEFMA